MPLVLKRRVNEAVVIDDQMKITVIEVSHGAVRLLFDGPRSMKVDRAEYWSELHRPQPAEACCDDADDDDAEIGGEGLR